LSTNSGSCGRIVTTSEPVLVIAFNRPDHLARLIDRLRQVRPQSLFIAIDGPRPSHPDDAERVQACRNLVSTIDWECQTRTLFQEANLGCGQGVSTAISWFFEQVDRGVILEDDILPDPSFFPFCTELLERYERNPAVFAVSGCNVVPTDVLARPQDPYRFSQVPLVWGWATWRRSWQQHRLHDVGWYRDLPPLALWRSSGRSLSGALFWATNFELTARGDVDTWDWQLVCAAMRSGAVTAISNVNLVDNIGFGEHATHTFGDESGLPATEPITLPTAPVPVRVDRRADHWSRRHHFHDRLLTTVDRVRKYAMGQREAGA
jgi:hypothetical protein